MRLIMIGVTDLRASIDIDDKPFLQKDTDPATSQRFKPRLPYGFLGSVARALGTRPADIDYGIPRVPYPTWPLIGRGLEIVLGDKAALVTRLRENAIRLIALDFPNVDYRVELRRSPGDIAPEFIEFTRDRLQTIIREAEIALTLRAYAVGFLVVRIELRSADPDLDTYWYPVSNILESATYHIRTIEGMFGEARRADLLDGLGEVNRALAELRVTLCRYFPPIVWRESSRDRLDEVEAGFQTVLRVGSHERWGDGLAIAKTLHGSGGMTAIATSTLDAHIGWAVIVFVERRDDGGDKPVFNAELCVLVYALFLFYERFLAEYLAAHVFSGKPIARKADVDAQRRFGDAIFYLADLGRGSDSGSDLAFYEAWRRVTKLDALRKKTSDGLNAVIERLSERNKRRTEVWAGRLAVITGLIGLTSLMEFMNGLREYLKKPEAGHDPLPTLLHLDFLGSAGHDVVAVYLAALFIILAAWLTSRLARK